MKRKIKKIFFDFEIIAFELVSLNTRFYRETYISLGVKLLTNSLKISDTTKTEFWELFWMIKKYDKDTALQIWTMFRAL